MAPAHRLLLLLRSRGAAAALRASLRCPVAAAPPACSGTASSCLAGSDRPRGAWGGAASSFARLASGRWFASDGKDASGASKAETPAKENRPSSKGEGTAPPAANTGSGQWREWVDSKIDQMEASAESQEQVSPAGRAVPSPSPIVGNLSSKYDAPAETRSAAQEPFAALLGRPPVDESLADTFYGYTALGTIGEGPSSPEDQTELHAGAIPLAKQPRLHPKRLFFPGDLYSPRDLDPYVVPEAKASRKAMKPTKRPNNDEVEQDIDFKNRAFLSLFISDFGQLQSRRRTQLRAKTHRKVMRAVKLARCMALLPPTAKLPEYARQTNPYTARQSIGEADD